MSQPFQYSLDNGATWESAGREGITVTRGARVLVRYFGKAVASQQAEAAPSPVGGSADLTDERQIVAAARKMCDLSAEACGIHPNDNWKIYGEEYRIDARQILEAAFSASRPAALAAQPEKNPLRRPLEIAEAALSDIGDADREPGDDLAWCEARAAKALPAVRAALVSHPQQGERNAN